jgi:hypothetical protein
MIVSKLDQIGAKEIKSSESFDIRIISVNLLLDCQKKMSEILVEYSSVWSEVAIDSSECYLPRQSATNGQKKLSFLKAIRSGATSSHQFLRTSYKVRVHFWREKSDKCLDVITGGGQL